MPKFFVVSDVHGFYDLMISELNKVGYDPSNENHWIISCGDNFDRGTQAKKMFEWLINTPRLIPIIGNHEDLLHDMIYRESFSSHDKSNGTVDTVDQFWRAYGDPDKFYWFAEKCVLTREKFIPFYRIMSDYFETKNYIFCHGWIPLNDTVNLPVHYQRGHNFSFNTDWRNASTKDWESARWINGFNVGMNGLNLTGKTIVFGHWHTSWARIADDPNFDVNAKMTEEEFLKLDFSPYYGKNYIGIDACTAATGKVNVLVIEDDWNE